jgi:argininosuccinate lyase
MLGALAAGFVNATEVADYLCPRGVPFRDAHAVAGKLVARALAAGTDLAGLPLETYRAEHPAFDPDVYDALKPERAVERRDLLGAPARARVEAAALEAVARLRARLAPAAG